MSSRLEVFLTFCCCVDVPKLVDHEKYGIAALDLPRSLPAKHCYLLIGDCTAPNIISRSNKLFRPPPKVHICLSSLPRYAIARIIVLACLGLPCFGKLPDGLVLRPSSLLIVIITIEPFPAFVAHQNHLYLKLKHANFGFFPPALRQSETEIPKRAPFLFVDPASVRLTLVENR